MSFRNEKCGWVPYKLPRFENENSKSMPLVTKNAIFLFSHRGIIFTMMPLNLKKFYIGAKIFETNPPHIEK